METQSAKESPVPGNSETQAAPMPILIEPAPLARRALFGFIITFIAARIVVLLIMSKSMPNLYFFMHGTHVHHLNYGIFLLAGVAAYLLFSARCDQDLKLAALFYGVAMALTFDEFGMWLHLGGSYWQRASVDAVIIVAAVLALIGFATAVRNFEARHLRASLLLLIALVAFSVVLYNTSERIGQVAGPRLEALEQASSP